MARKGYPKWYPRKNWSDLTPAVRKRHERNGITRKSYYTKAGQSKVTASRGHARTPERPERAMRNPQRYPEYVQKRQRIADEFPGRLAQQARERHRRFFSSRLNWSKRTDRRKDWNQYEEDSPDALVAFMGMSQHKADEIASELGSHMIRKIEQIEIDGVEYDVVDWEWLLYH